MSKLPTIEEFKKLSKSEQKRWIERTNPKEANRAERRREEKLKRRSKK